MRCFLSKADAVISGPVPGRLGPHSVCVHTRYLDNTKQMVLLKGFDPSFPPWKGSVLASRRQEHKITLNFLKNIAWFLKRRMYSTRIGRHVNQSVVKIQHNLEWVTGFEPAWNGFAIRGLTIQLHTHIKLGTSGENRTHISRLSGATGYKSAVLPLNYRGMAESNGFEPLRPFLNDRLAICWFNHSPNSPLFGGRLQNRTVTP